MRKDSIRDRLGRCFELNYKFVMAHKDYLLVHGYVTNFKNKPPVSIAHAWCRKGDIIYDAVLNSSNEMEAYQLFYGTQDMYVYSAEEAERFTLTDDTYGPWQEL